MNATPVPSSRALRHAAILVRATLAHTEVIGRVPTDAPVGLDAAIDLGHPLFAALTPDDAWSVLNSGRVAAPGLDGDPPADRAVAMEASMFDYLSRADAALWLVPRMATVVSLAALIEAGEATILEEAVVALRAISLVDERPFPQ